MQSKLKSALKGIRETFSTSRWALSYSFSKLFKLTIIFAALVVVMALIPYLTNWLQANLIDALLAETDPAKSALVSVKTAFILFLAFLTLSRVLNSLRSYCEQIYSLEFSEKLVYDMLNAYATLDLESWEDPEFNNKLNRVQNAYLYRTKNLINSIIYLVQDFIVVVTALILLGNVSVTLILVIVLTVVPPVINDFIHGKRMYGIWNADVVLQRNFNYTASYLQNERNLLEVKVYQLKDYFLSLVKKYYSGFKNKEKSVESRRAFYGTMLTLISLLGFGYAGWTLISQVRLGLITIGLLTFYLSSIQQFSWALSSMLRGFSKIYEDSLFVKDASEIMNLQPKIVGGTIKLAKHSVPPRIEFRNVWFKYPKTKKYIFKDINFTIDPYENLAIVGENGAGKTTLVKILCRFYDVTKGEILIDGVNIKDLNLKSWYEKIAFLTQDFSRYHFDVRTNIGVGNITNIQNTAGIEKSSRLAGAHVFVSHYEKGYQQVLSRRFDNGIEPSTGQWQKIALARAFFKDSPLLILDEPTSAIDPKAEYHIFRKIFESFGVKKSILIISHRFSTVRKAHRIIVLHQGVIVEDGTHEELMDLGGRYKTNFDLQKEAFES